MQSFYVVIAFISVLSGCTASSSSLTSVRAGNCDRDCLVVIANDYLDALAANDPSAAALADELQFVENITPLAAGEGLWQQVNAVSGSYRILVPDEEQGNVGLMAVVQRRGDDGLDLALLAALL